jgi:hypothetical protein
MGEVFLALNESKLYNMENCKWATPLFPFEKITEDIRSL